MKILELNFERTWRGGERQTLYNLLGFRNAGMPVELVCRKGYPMEQKAVADGFKVFSFHNIFGVMFFLMANGRKYDILHAQTSHILTYCILTKPFHRCKVVFTRRVDFVPKGKMTRLKYRLADSVIAISNAIRQILENFSGRNIDLVSEIFMKKQLNAERAEKIAASVNAHNKKYIIGTTAALVPHKDPLTMVAAIGALSKMRNDFVFLHFGAGELEQPVKEKIAENKLGDVYKMMGFHDGIEDIFSVLDVFVMSSEEEGLGSSVLDAFIYKVPVVSTNAGGLIDLIKDGRGIVCNIKSPGEIAAGINDILEQPELKTAITTAAYDYVVVKHSMEYITGEYLRVFRQLL